MNLPAKRFYTAAGVAEDADGVGVALDARRLRTPGGSRFAAPTRALAEAVAAEWDAQADTIAPATMPITQLAFAAVDRPAGDRAALAAHVAAYAETDLVSHRAEKPDALVARQAKHWDPIVAWAAETLDLRAPVVVGVLPAAGGAGAALRAAAIAEALDDFRLTGLAHAVGCAGSAAIGFALMRRRLDAREAFEAACLDDLFSLETWGEDEAARARLEALYLEFLALERYFASLA
jgi:chaperone required for assembly of F1-ATPase